MALTDLQIKKLKTTGKEYQKAHDRGLSLVVRAGGAKFWRYDFRLDGKKQKYGYGNYPDITIAEANSLHAVAHKLVEHGRHPSEVLEDVNVRRVILAGGSLNEAEAVLSQERERALIASRLTFGEVAGHYKSEWVDRNWKSPDKGYIPVRLHLLPKLGDKALEDIDAPMLRELFYDVRERKGTQSALHAHNWCTRIFAYALEHDWCKNNPAQAIKAARIGQRGKRERYLTMPEIRRYLVGLYQSNCYRGYKLALHLLLMLALRKNELCEANWSEFDLDTAEWLIPVARMKTKKEHLVLLPEQAIAMLRELMRLGGGSPWVLPMPTDPKRPMNGNNLDGAHAAAINAAGIEDYVIHDHRHTVSTQLRDQGLGLHTEIVETALSHAIPGMAGRYSHALYKSQRIAMLQQWADLLDSIMTEQAVVHATFRKVS